MQINNNRSIIHSYYDNSCQESPQTLQESCINYLRKSIVADTLNSGPIFRHFQLYLSSSLHSKALPEKRILGDSDFPLSQYDLESIYKSDVKYIMLEDNAVFSKEAFLVAYDWKVAQGYTPIFTDFCLINSNSLYHDTSSPFFAPAVIVEMLDKEIGYVIRLQSVNKAEVYEKLVKFFCTLEIEKLVDLIAANHSSQLNKCFPKAWQIIQRILPIMDGWENSYSPQKKRIIDLINEWLKGENPNLLNKLDRLTGGYKAGYDNHSAELFDQGVCPLDGISLSYLGYERLWKLTVDSHPENLLKLKDLPIYELAIVSMINLEQLKAVAGPHLKEVGISLNEELPQDVLDFLKTLPIESVYLSRKSSDIHSHYISSTVKQLQMFDVTVEVLWAVKKSKLESINISNNKKLRNSHFQFLRQLPLKNLYLNNVEKISCRALGFLRSSELEKVSLSGENLSDGIRWLKNPSKIQELDLWHMTISMAAMRVIAKLPNLKRLSLFDCKASREEEFEFLATSESLKSIWLSGVPISENRVASLRAKGISVMGKFLSPKPSATWDMTLGYLIDWSKTNLDLISERLEQNNKAPDDSDSESLKSI